MDLQEMIQRIAPPDEAAMRAARERLNALAKPLGSMGAFEDAVEKLAGIYGKADFTFGKKAVVVMCADNGIVAQGVSGAGSDVTAIMAAGFLQMQTAVCKLAEAAGADVIPVDMGMVSEVPGLRAHRLGAGTKDFSAEPAMTRAQAVDGILYGVSLVEELAAQGYNLLATGEMGIGNTTTSAACASVLTGISVAKATGRGTGLSDEAFARKAQLIDDAIALHKPDANDPLDVLAKLGGFDIAGLIGIYLGGAVYHVPVVIDGLISSVAALFAQRLCPTAAAYMLPSHLTREPAGAAVMDALGMEPLITAGMRLGEGTGAVMGIQLLTMMAHLYTAMPTLGELLITSYKPKG